MIDFKVFGIGLNKTGTTTLGECGKILGMRTISCQRNLLEDVVVHSNFSRVKKVVAEYDLFEDWPWPLIYKELDNLYPGSKFILTTRESDEVWFNSLKQHSLSTSTLRHCRKLAYGYDYPHGKKKEHKKIYNSHNDAVRCYFSNRDDDFIELCWENGDSWRELCHFLNFDVPNVPFPHANKASDRRVPMNRLIMNRIKSLFD